MIYGFTVYDFIELFCDDSASCAIYDLRTDTELFRGDMSEAKYADCADYEVQSVDFCEYDGKNGGVYFVINIETDEDDEESEDEDDV